MSVQFLESHIQQFITRFREKLPERSQRLQPFAVDGSLWRSHCQVFVFWFQDNTRQIDYQVFVTTYWEDVPDLSVKVFGPFAPEDIIPKVEESLHDPTWSREIVSDGRFLFDRMPFRELLEGSLVQAIGRFFEYWRNPAFHGPFSHSYFMSGFRIGPKTFIQHFLGNFCDIDIEKEFEATIPVQQVPQIKQQSKPHIANPSKDRAKGFGVHFYPPFWIGESPKLTFREKVEGIQAWVFRKVLGVTLYRKKQLLYRWDGFIALVEENPEQALRDFIRIMAIAFLLGYDVTAVREIELSDLTIDLSDNTFLSQHCTLATPRSEPEHWDHQKLTARGISEKKVMSEQELSSILQTAENASIDAEMDKDLAFMLEGYTHFRQFQYPTAFMLSYIVIERYIARLYPRSLSLSSPTTAIQQDSITPKYPTTAYQLNRLKTLRQLKRGEYKILVSLKRKRNGFIHNGVSLTEDDARECLVYCEDILKQVLNISYQKQNII